MFLTSLSRFIEYIYLVLVVILIFVLVVSVVLWFLVCLLCVLLLGGVIVLGVWVCVSWVCVLGYQFGESAACCGGLCGDFEDACERLLLFNECLSVGGM